MSFWLASPEQAYAWELRTAWALGREVILVLEGTLLPRVRGFVARVATSGAFVMMDDGLGEPIHVPCRCILAIRSPHFHEGDAPRDRPRPARETFPGQLPLFEEEVNDAL